MSMKNALSGGRPWVLEAARLTAATAASGSCFASLHIGSFAAHDLSRLAQLLAMLVCAIAWLGGSSVGLPRLSLPVRRAWIGSCTLVALALLTSSLLAAQPVMALRELALWLGTISVAMVFVQVTGIDSWRRWVLALGSLATLYCVIVTIVIVMAAAQGLTVSRSELFFGYDNYRFFNHVQTVSLPVVLISLAVVDSGVTSKHGRWLKCWLWAGATCSFALLWIASGRATGLGLLCGAVVVLAGLGSRARSMLLRTAIACAAGSALCAVLMHGLPLLTGNVAIDTTRELGDLGSYRARLYLWELAWAQAQASPWLGAGPMHFAHVPNTEGAHPHNLYLQVAAECGLPVAIAFVLAIGWAIRRLLMCARAQSTPREQDIGSGLLLAGVAVVVDAAFSGNFVMPLSQMWIAILAGLCVAWCGFGGSGNDPRDVPRRSVLGTVAMRLVAAIVMITQVALIASVWPEATDLDAHLMQVTRDLSIGSRSNPRFWSAGWF